MPSNSMKARLTELESRIDKHADYLILFLEDYKMASLHGKELREFLKTDQEEYEGYKIEDRFWIEV